MCSGNIYVHIAQALTWKLWEVTLLRNNYWKNLNSRVLKCFVFVLWRFFAFQCRLQRPTKHSVRNISKTKNTAGTLLYCFALQYAKIKHNWKILSPLGVKFKKLSKLWCIFQFIALSLCFYKEKQENLAITFFFNILTHSFSMQPFSTPWKHQRTVIFSEVFRGRKKVQWERMD